MQHEKNWSDENGITVLLVKVVSHPKVDPAFRRLQTLSAEELTKHIERLERDLDDLTAGVDAWKGAIDASND